MSIKIKKAIVLISVTGIIFVGISIWWNNGLQAADPKNKKEYIFLIQKGEEIRQIANKLKKEKLIKDPVVFFLLVKQLGYDNKIQAGDFRLSPSMTASKIAEQLTHGTLDIWVTIPEGKRATEIAEILKQTFPQHKDSWKNQLAGQEGYLFPDTYLFPKNTDIALIISLMKKNFDKKYESIESPQNKFTKEEVVILASMVEREARLDEDRPLVASVMINRLNIKMALQIDATVQYALGYQKDKKTWWKKDLTQNDLKVESPYNTYLHAGLPPAPIANPGEKALKAVITPSKTDYLYYISDKQGVNHYAKTLSEHNANIKKYGL